MRSTGWLCLGLVVTIAAACADGGKDTPATPTPSPSPTIGYAKVPLMDLGAGNYLGFGGGLYLAGGNTMPGAHAAEGALRAAAIEPLDVNGNPSASGKYVLLSIGMSNTTQEFCVAGGVGACSAWSFGGQAALDGAVNTSTLAIVNGAKSGAVVGSWDQPSDVLYNEVRDLRLTPLGLSTSQVQIAWLKVAIANPSVSLPAANSDTFALETGIGSVVRAMKARFPNLKMVFISNRIYGGYATTSLNPEPYAYESGFAVKWAIEAQIIQTANAGGVVDPESGNLDYATVAPWIGWGPYLWADGTAPNSEGLTWDISDLEADGTHPSQSGEQKVGAKLLEFFKTSPFTSCWFLAGGSC